MIKTISWKLFTKLVERYGYPMPKIKGRIALGLLRLSN